MKKKRGILGVLMLFAFVFVLSVPQQADAATYKWVTVNGQRRCFRNKKLVVSAWVGNYHLNAQGYMDVDTWVNKKVNGVTQKVFVRHDGKYVPNFKGGWQTIGKYKYLYKASGKLYKNTWVSIKSSGKTKKYYIGSKGYCYTGLKKMKEGYRYFGSDGAMRTGWQTINKKKYCFRKTNGVAYVNGKNKISNGKYYYFTSKGVMQTGWKKISGKYYYFKNYMRTGWITVSGKKYYMASNGARVTGVYGIGGKLYYFSTSNGALLKNVTVTYNGRKYTVGSDGTCTLVPSTTTPSAKMLFFLTFESGSEAYKQTGGDNGCACGAYQFDYRYSLLSFVKYAYGANAKLCAEFKTYAAYPDTEAYKKKLKSNKTFYKAWTTIYNRNPLLFSELQDKYAKANYYNPVEQELSRKGINLAVRSDVVKGAVYSYSIQHGQTSAVNAVLAAKITATTSDKDFINKLYNYRIKQFPGYKTRYTAEKKKALSLL